MRYLKPHFYDQFVCTAGDCPDTCCAGWQIVIDEDSLERYGNEKSEFGKRLRNSIDWEEECFYQNNRRCAFLNDENLCDLYKELGPDSLCDTCRLYPRHTEEYEGLRELSLSLSCPEAARIILSCKEPVRFLEEETDEEGNPVEKSDEEKAAEFETAKADALALAQELQAKLTAGSDSQALAEEYGDKVYNSSAHISAVGSNFASAQYADWLYDASRKAGDVTLAENDRSDSFVYNYYVVQFDSRARDESSTADVRHILIGAGSNPTEEQYAAAEESAQAMLDQWKAEGGTEDAFALLAMENTADSGSQATGGLYTGGSSANAWDQNFLDWALDPARQSGDTGLVKNESSSTKGWHIMYFVGWNDPSWMYSVKTTLKSEDMTEWMDSLTAEAEVVQGSGISHIS